jgi:putative hemolysin
MQTSIKKYLLLFVAGLSLIFALSGCQKTAAPEVSKDKSDANLPVSMANPASENCVKNGGRLEIRTNKLGQYGVCLFEDNRQCEEWALMRGQCPVGGLKITGYDNDAEIYCAITGGTVEGVGTATPMCKRIDGTLCNAQANLDGECPDPNNPTPNAGNVEAQ